MARSSDDDDRPARAGAASPWRTVFDAVEQPIARSSEAWVQSGPFMDGLSLAWRLGRRAERELHRGLDMWLGAWRLATRGDIDRLSNEVARIERELRALRRDHADAAPTPADGATPRRASSTRRAPNPNRRR